MVIFCEIITIEDLGRYYSLFAIALDLNTIVFGKVERFIHLNNTANYLISEGGNIYNSKFLIALVNFNLLVACDSYLRSQAVSDCMLTLHTCKSKLLNLSESLTTILACVLSGITCLKPNEGFFALDYCESVFAIILSCIAPCASAGLGAISTNDEANLLNSFRNVDYSLCTVFTFVQKIS